MLNKLSQLKWFAIMAVFVATICMLAFTPEAQAQDSQYEDGHVVVDTFDTFDDVSNPDIVNRRVSLVTPCRIVDTRVVGQIFFPGTRREFYIYGVGPGVFGIIQQGGNPAGCLLPAGLPEPDGVIMNVAVVPVAGQGNFGAFAANIAPPFAGFINYRTGVQNISNTTIVETFDDGGAGARELELINRVGTAHVVIDVLGYVN